MERSANKTDKEQLKITNLQRPELLSPAGNYECFVAAVKAGADAVYAGGTRFGARAYADNFTQDEMLKAIDYAHLRDRKLYLTVNTVLKNQETDELFDYIRPFYENGLDGVIVQDYGVPDDGIISDVAGLEKYRVFNGSVDDTSAGNKGISHLCARIVFCRRQIINL